MKHLRPNKSQHQKQKDVICIRMKLYFLFLHIDTNQITSNSHKTEDNSGTFWLTLSEHSLFIMIDRVKQVFEIQLELFRNFLVCRYLILRSRSLLNGLFHWKLLGIFESLNMVSLSPSIQTVSGSCSIVVQQQYCNSKVICHRFRSKCIVLFCSVVICAAFLSFFFFLR